MYLRHLLRSLYFSLSILLFLIGLIGGQDRAEARTRKNVSHSYDRVWPATVRFLRVDEKLRVTEKDMDNGYVLFELVEENKVFPGSVELVRRKDSSQRDAVELIVQITDRPSYMEVSMLNRLSDKLRKELGQPPKPPEPKPLKPNPPANAPKQDPPANTPTPVDPPPKVSPNTSQTKGVLQHTAISITSQDDL